jgi:putative NADH-flavin reductase
MKLTIFGATGGTGLHLVPQALDAGHHVTAVVRDATRLPFRHANLDVRVADVLDPAAIEPAVKGADAVLSALGPRGRKAPPVCAPAVHSMLTAMRASGPRRIVAVSAAPVPDHDPGDGLLLRLTLRPLLRALLRDVYADHGRMEQELRDSGLDWTIIRPPQLLNRPFTGRYRTARNQNVRGGHRISRGDLAHAMLRLLDDNTSIRTTLGIGY